MSKRKGSNTERELVKKFIAVGWQALRIAGSGMLNLAPDVLAGSPGRLLVIECKSSGKDVLYIDKQEILNTIDYANKFGGEPWYGVRFDRSEWKFIIAHELLGNHKITKERPGMHFDILILKDKKIF